MPDSDSTPWFSLHLHVLPPSVGPSRRAPSPARSPRRPARSCRDPTPSGSPRPAPTSPQGAAATVGLGKETPGGGREAPGDLSRTLRARAAGGPDPTASAAPGAPIGTAAPAPHYLLRSAGSAEGVLTLAPAARGSEAKRQTTIASAAKDNRKPAAKNARAPREPDPHLPPRE